MEIGKDFLSKWKSMSVAENDMMDFDFDTVVKGKKKTYDFDHFFGLGGSLMKEEKTSKENQDSKGASNIIEFQDPSFQCACECESTPDIAVELEGEVSSLDTKMSTSSDGEQDVHGKLTVGLKFKNEKMQLEDSLPQDMAESLKNDGKRNSFGRDDRTPTGSIIDVEPAQADSMTYRESYNSTSKLLLAPLSCGTTVSNVISVKEETSGIWSKFFKSDEYEQAFKIHHLEMTGSVALDSREQIIKFISCQTPLSHLCKVINLFYFIFVNMCCLEFGGDGDEEEEMEEDEDEDEEEEEEENEEDEEEMEEDGDEEDEIIAVAEIEEGWHLSGYNYYMTKGGRNGIRIPTDVGDEGNRMYIASKHGRFCWEVSMIKVEEGLVQQQKSWIYRANNWSNRAVSVWFDCDIGRFLALAPGVF